MYKLDKAKAPLLKELVETTILAGLIFVILQITVQNYQVEGSSMLPTLNPDDCVLANKFTYSRIDKSKYGDFLPSIDPHQGHLLFLFHPPRRGEIVIFEYPQDRSRHFVKRVIGVPGDEVRIQNGAVFVNKHEILEPYLDRSHSTSNHGPIIVGTGEYFVLGDNRLSSNDSRAWGTINNDHIIGKYWFEYSSFLCNLAPIDRGNLK
jgi:signal peptidase I